MFVKANVELFLNMKTFCILSQTFLTLCRRYSIVMTFENICSMLSESPPWNKNEQNNIPIESMHT